MSTKMDWKEEIVSAIDADVNPQGSELNQQILETLRAHTPEPMPIGRDALLRKLSPKRSFRPMVALGMAVAILGISVILLPVFAQSKVAAKRTQALSDRKMVAMARKALPAESVEGVMAIDGMKASVAAGKASAGAPSALAAPSLPYQASNLPPLIAAKVIRTASVKVEVDDVAKAQREVLLAVRAQGGFSETGTFNDSNDGPQQATLQLRVPEAKYDLILDNIQAMGKVLSMTNTGQDVSLEVASGTASINTLRVQEEEMRQMLQRAKSTAEILQLKNQVNVIRRQLAVEDAQQRVLKSQVAYSTITLELQGKSGFMPSLSSGWIGTSFETATGLLAGLAQFLGQILIFLVVLSPLWGPVVYLVIRERRKGI